MTTYDAPTRTSQTEKRQLTTTKRGRVWAKESKSVRWRFQVQVMPIAQYLKGKTDVPQ